MVCYKCKDEINYKFVELGSIYPFIHSIRNQKYGKCEPVKIIPIIPDIPKIPAIPGCSTNITAG